MGGVVNTTKKAFNDTTSQIGTAFTNPKKLNFGQIINASTGGGASPLEQAYHTETKGPDTVTPPDPFNMDPAQSTADQQAINALGQQQYTDTLAGIDKNSSAQQKYASDQLKQITPQVAEDLNSQHLLNSSAYPQELARQATILSQGVGTQNAQQKMAALQGLQGSQLGAVQRGLSLQDFSNSAKVAQSIGATTAPPPPNSKGTAVQGASAGATAGTSILPGWGTAIGAGAGYLAGGVAGGGARGK